MVQQVMKHDDKPVLGSNGLSRSHRLAPVWLWILVLGYIVIFSAASILKHNTFHSYTLDLGIMSQTIWNTAHGHFFEISLDRPLDSQLVGNYLGNHIRPIFLLIAPLYRLWPNPRLLLLLQSTALGLGAIPLFWIARRELKTAWLPTGLIISYLLYPALGYINLFDFHPVALTIPLLFIAYWALLEKRQAIFWIAILLTLGAKEELVVVVGAFGLYCLSRPQWRKQGLYLLILAIVWAFFSFVIIAPYYNEGRPYRFFTLWSHMLPEQLTGGLVEGNTIHPDTPNLAFGEALLFAFFLLLPLGFLPLLGPGLFAVSLPSLAYLMLGNDTALRSFDAQYPAVLIPWFFLATVQGLARLERWSDTRQKVRIKRLALYLLLVCTLIMNFLLNPILLNWLVGNFSHISYHNQIRAAMVQIPAQAGVVTINPFGPHLSHRRYLMDLSVYSPPLPQNHLQQIDYVLLDLVDCRAIDAAQPRGVYSEMVFQLLDSQQFGVRYWSEPILLLERNRPPGPELDQIRTRVEELVRRKRPCRP